MLHTTKKLFAAIGDVLLLRRGATPPRLIMTLLVKNEQTILEHNLRFHKAMGVDGFIITNNNSSDRTGEVIQKYIDKGWVVEVINEKGAFIQKTIVDKMILSAKKNHNADWIINCDADEFWYSPSGDLKAEMKRGVNVLRCKSTNVYPEDEKPFYEWDKVISPIPDSSVYDLSEFNMYRRYTYKVAHAARGYIQISVGNHKVKMLPSVKKESEIAIFHYNVLSREAFVDKTAKSGPRPHLKKTKKKKGKSRHWRYFYALYKEGKLEQEYDRVIGKNYFEEFQKLGYIVRDDRVVETFKRLEE